MRRLLTAGFGLSLFASATFALNVNYQVRVDQVRHFDSGFIVCSDGLFDAEEYTAIVSAFDNTGIGGTSNSPCLTVDIEGNANTFPGVTFRTMTNSAATTITLGMFAFEDDIAPRCTADGVFDSCVLSNNALVTIGFRAFPTNFTYGFFGDSSHDMLVNITWSYVVPHGFTELFTGGADSNDLAFKSVTYTPDASAEGYTACIVPAAQFPTDPTGGTALTLADDSFAGVTSALGQVELFGVSYSNLFVGSNGYITFGTGDTIFAESTASHFILPRISALFDDLNPPQAGTISWRDLPDRLAVTYQGVTEHNEANSNSFQFELFFDGRIRITWLEIAAEDGVVGLSAGVGTPPVFAETDVSGLTSCYAASGGFTELFSGGSDTNDLEFRTVTFTPADTPEGYIACIQPAAQFLTDPTGGTALPLNDDDFVEVTSTLGQVVLYGVSYSNLFVGSNGYITFGSGGNANYSDLSVHFGQLRISALLDDLNPAQAGSVSWRNLPDRVAVTYQGVTRHNAGNSNTFQIELFFDGRIRITWLGIDDDIGLVGLSPGLGTPPGFAETDVSGLTACPTFNAAPFSPVHAADSVPAGSGVLVNFSENLVASSVNSNSFKVWGRQTGFYSGTNDFSACASCGDFYALANFKPGEEIFVMLNSGILSVNDRVLNPRQYQFTVAASGCTNFLFYEYSQLPPADPTAAVALGDVNGDGTLDLAVANRDAIFRSTLIYVNDGAGNFSNSGQQLETNHMHALAFGDLDHDNDLDLVIGKTPGGVKVFMNDSFGFFSNSGQSLGSVAYAVALGDVDGDGDLDLVKASSVSDPGRVYRNNGTGVFTDSGQLISSNATASLALGDLDGDGDLDLATGNDSNEAERVYLNNGSGVFADSGQSLGGDFTRSIALGDVDGDVDLDLVTADYAGQDALYLNNGSGVFTNSGQALGGDFAFAMALGDVDGDADLDIVKANFANQPARVFLNNGAGIFSNSGMAIDSVVVRSLALGDLDGDNDLDLVTGNYNSQIRVFKNVSCPNAGDDDFDFIPTPVEVQNGLNPVNPADANSDNDGDTQTALEEYIAGSQMTNGASYFRVQTFIRGSNSVYFSYPVVAGRVYTPEQRINLVAPPAWSPMNTFTAPVDTTASSLEIALTNNRSFRVKVSLPP